MGIFLAFFVVVSLVCLILLIKIKLKQRRSQVIALALNLKGLNTQQALFSLSAPDGSCSDRSAAVAGYSCVLTQRRLAFGTRALN